MLHSVICHSKVVVKGSGERVAELLRVLYHFVESLVALVDQRIVLFDLVVLRLHVETQSLFLTLQRHYLLF